MILEVADIRIKFGLQPQFEEAVQRGLATVIAKSKGFRGYQVHHSIESPERYILMLKWDALEDHTIGFRESDAFTEWRGIVVDFFAQAPFTEHFNLVGASVD